MINPNEIENQNISHEIKKKIKRNIEYKIPFPKSLASSFEKFIDTFHSSYEKLFNYLLNDHFNFLHYEIKEDDNELLIFYYFCVDAIFSENNSSSYKSPCNQEANTQNITVKITEEYDTVIKEICEVIYYKPEMFVSKAIRCQWERIQSDIDAGYYYIIDDFCNVSKIKQALEEALKESKTNKNISKNE